MPAALDVDALVLGAGIVGTCTALHLVKRGRRVCLVDRAAPGMGTSYGNAGLIERSSVIPYAFPHDIRRIVRYALNREPDVHYHLGALLALSGWLLRYWRESGPERLAGAARDLLPLIERCVAEHDLLIREADVAHLIQSDGWIEVYRERRDLDAAVRDVEGLAPYKLHVEPLDHAALQVREPGLIGALAGGIHWRDPWAVSDPGALVQGYARLYERLGGRCERADARTLEPDGAGWRVRSDAGRMLRARDVVVALGPDCPPLLRALGYRIPLAVKRGYHRHYRPPADRPALRHPICETQGGYVLSNMTRGVRLTTGVELAAADAAPDLTQLQRAHALAQDIFPLGEAVESQPWIGRRPCLPDMRPVIGKAPRHAGLWFNFGHCHHGLTLGPVSGRLLAEMMTGAETCVDPRPFAAARFDRA